MKIGILTYHRSHNYGAYLQAYSLSHALNDIEGISCEIINYNLEKEDKIYKKRIYKRPIYARVYNQQDKMFEVAQQEQLLSGELYLDDNYENILNIIENKYDVLVAGSDEIWRIASRGFPNVYWIPGKHNFVKMSYAASGRMSLDKVTADQQKTLSQLYTDFSYIGVRDEATKIFVEKLCPDINIHRNCDPAFLYHRFKDKSGLRHEICEKWNLNEKKKIIAIMYDRPEVIGKLRRRLGKNYQFVCIARPMWNADINLCSVTPFEWVDIIGGCDYLVSSYFHGMLFAVNQNTPFVVIDRRADRNNILNSKLYDFLKYTGIEERYFISNEIEDEVWDKIAEKISTEVDLKNTDFLKIVEDQKALFQNFLEELNRFKNE